MAEKSSSSKSSLKKIGWVLLVLVGIVSIVAVLTFIKHLRQKNEEAGRLEQDSQSQGNPTQDYALEIQKKETETAGRNSNFQNNSPDPSKSKAKHPACPADLSGILTAPLMEPQYIAAMLPLGNVTPPGHTYPIDHIYFQVNTDEQVPLYAPANGWITHIMANSVKKTAESDYTFDSFVVTYTICDGLVLDFAGYTDVIQPIKDELAKHTDSCKDGIMKAGHINAGEQQCDYQELDIPVTANELIGYTHRELRPDGGGYNIPFEIWAANYNQPSRSDVDWSYYDDNRYAHAVCTFDLYDSTWKSQFEAKFGMWSDGHKDKNGKINSGPGEFIPRTVEPLCGEIVQDIAGTLQGAWFSAKPDKNDKSGNIGNSGYGISFIHNNVDPTLGEVVVGGEFADQLVSVTTFTPAHSGTINREPAEIKADGQTYCYGIINPMNTGSAGGDGKILVRMIDDHHIEADRQAGNCTETETIQKVYSFSR